MKLHVVLLVAVGKCHAKPQPNMQNRYGEERGLKNGQGAASKAASFPDSPAVGLSAALDCRTLGSLAGVAPSFGGVRCRAVQWWGAGRGSVCRAWSVGAGRVTPAFRGMFLGSWAVLLPSGPSVRAAGRSTRRSTHARPGVDMQHGPAIRFAYSYPTNQE